MKVPGGPKKAIRVTSEEDTENVDEVTLRRLLDDVRTGAVSADDAVARLRRLPFADLGFARVDHHRTLRQGLPEAVYAPGDGLDPYRRLLNSCRDGKLETGGMLLIQFHRNALAANCWELEDLRERLEHST